MKNAAPAIIAILALGCRPQSNTVATSPPTPPQVFANAAHERDWKPVFTEIEGRELRPFEEPGVKAVVLVFVLDDCPIANSYIPELNRLHAAFESRGIRQLIVDADPATTVDRAREHAKQYSITAPVLLDSDHAWVKYAGATKTPEVAVLSATGDILYRGRIDDQYPGLGKRRTQATSHDLEDALSAILADQPVTKPTTEVIGCYIPELPPGGK